MPEPDTAAVGWTVHHAILDDVLHGQYEQAFSRMEGMTDVEMLAFRALCHQLVGMSNVVRLPKERATNGT